MPRGILNRKILLFLIILLTFNTYSTVIYASTSVFKHLDNPHHELNQDKEILSQFKNDIYVPLLVEMSEQVDTSAVAEEVKESLRLSNDVTPFELKMQTRHAVVNALKNKAEKSQESFLKFLERETRVKAVQSFYIMNVISLQATEEDYKRILKHPKVAKVRLDRKIEIDWPEINNNKIHIDMQDEEETIEWNIKQIQADKVWDEYGVDGSGVVIGMIDSGIHWNHDALKTKWRGYDPNNPNQPKPEGNWFDAVNGEALPYDISANPHGTHVMGTILGEDQAGNNKIGVAPGAKWIAAKAFTLDGGKDSWLLAAGEFMLAPNGDPELAPDIINNSWGGGAGLDEWYRPMVQAWRNAQIIPIFSAGNTTTGSVPGSVSAPSNYPESISVAATDKDNIRGVFSHQGPGPYDGFIKPDISAPGVNIRSSVPNGYQAGWSGTSMAAPHISGVAALLRSIDASLTVEEFDTILKNTAKPLTDSQYPETPNYGYGYGLLNAYDAVKSIAQDSGKVTGRVLKEGSDHNPPVIEHEANWFDYENLPRIITARIIDDVSVVNAQLLVRNNKSDEWTTVEMVRKSGDFTDGIYEIEVPQKFIEVPGYQYKIRAEDFSGNIEETNIHSIEVRFGIDLSTTFKHNFNDSLPGEIYSGDWEVGEPTVGPNPLTGEYLLATNLRDNYSHDLKSVYQLPPLDLRNVNKASLKFSHWFDIEYEYDIAKVLVSNGNKNIEEWDVLKEFTGRERSWYEEEISLHDVSGSDDQVFIAFVLESDNQISHAGWYIDNFEISGQIQGEFANSVEKSSVNANTMTGLSNDNIGLPLEAYVTVVETGRTVKSSLEDGSYTIHHQATPKDEAYTLRVEAYGYYLEEKKFQLKDGEILIEDFLMRKIPTGNLTVTVNEKNKNHFLEDVKIKVLNDHRIEPLYTNEEGVVTFENILEGSYTLQLSKDNFYIEEITVDISGGETESLSIELEVFPGNLIAYDSGSADNSIAFNQKGFGFATRFTPEKNAEVIGASVYLWEENFPYPGGNQLYVTVYDSDKEGRPNKQLFEPIKYEGVRGQWNFIDLKDYDVDVTGDYYIVLIQPVDFDQAVAVALDETGEFADRTYIMDNNSNFEKLGSNYGNWLLRSHVIYEDEGYEPVPPILDPISETYTKETTVTITGMVEIDGLVKLYLNDNKIEEISTVGQVFSAEIPLIEGENRIYATFVNNLGEESEKSNEIVVIRHTEVSTLEITSPSKDVYLLPEEELIISYDSDVSGGEGTIILKDERGKIVHQLKAKEVQPYKYMVSWNYSKEQFKHMTISIQHADELGNEVDLVLPHYIYPIAEKVDRLYGGSRYETAFAISDQGWEKADTVIIATGLDFADALAGVPLSKHLDAPILLTKGSKISDDLINELNRLEASQAIILGGRLAVPESIEDSLVDLGLTVERIYGQTRSGTAVNIAKYLGKTHDRAVFVNAFDFPDAMSAALYAAQQDLPILLSHTGKLSLETRNAVDEFNIQESIIIGGRLAVSEDVEGELPEVSRIYGQSRFDTNVEVLKKYESRSNHMYVSTGWDFADALTGATLAVKRGADLLLVDKEIKGSVKQYLEDSDVESISVIGGRLAISDEIVEELLEVINE